MKNKNKERVKNETNRRVYKILTTINQDPYWEDYYLIRPKGKLVWKRKELFSYQKRMYKSWKHNRKTQWKDKVRNEC